MSLLKLIDLRKTKMSFNCAKDLRSCQSQVAQSVREVGFKEVF